MARSPARIALAVAWGGLILGGAIGAVMLGVWPEAVPVAAGPRAGAAPPLRDVPPAAPGTPIAATDPALLEAAPGFPGMNMARVSDDGRRAMQVYAGGYDPADTRPRIAIVLGGIGVPGPNGSVSPLALPAAVSFAVSPYASEIGPLLAAARASGHEILLALPMESDAAADDDPGPRAMRLADTAAANRERLIWMLSRQDNAVGALGALGRAHGERFAQGDGFAAMLAMLSAHGLLYLDPQPGPNGRDIRHVDLIVDAAPVRQDMLAALDRLERIAHDRGSAIGLVNLPRPAALEVLEVWESQLTAHGLTLVPVSALYRQGPPQ